MACKINGLTPPSGNNFRATNDVRDIDGDGKVSKGDFKSTFLFEQAKNAGAIGKSWSEFDDIMQKYEQRTEEEKQQSENSKEMDQTIAVQNKDSLLEKVKNFFNSNRLNTTDSE